MIHLSVSLQMKITLRQISNDECEIEFNFLDYPWWWEHFRFDSETRTKTTANQKLIQYLMDSDLYLTIGRVNCVQIDMHNFFFHGSADFHNFNNNNKHTISFASNIKAIRYLHKVLINIVLLNQYFSFCRNRFLSESHEIKFREVVKNYE